MKNKRLWLFATIFPLLFLGQVIAEPSPVYACKCADRILPPTPPPTLTAQEPTTEYEAVFLGAVLEIQTDQAKSDLSGNRTVVIQVDTSWKGVEKPLVMVKTGSVNGDCGFEFLVGKRYLVYAYGSLSDNDLWSNICTPTGRVADDGEEVTETRIGKFPKYGYGKIVTQEDITALGEGKQLSSETMVRPPSASQEQSNGSNTLVASVVTGLALGFGLVVAFRLRKAHVRTKP